jgi:hypothetical protein
MRKISTILVALVMLAMCASSYGYFLIYNVSTTVGAVDFATEFDLKVSIPLKGYLVLVLNDSDVVQDFNLILYGKDASTPKKPVYVLLNSLQSSGSNYLNLYVDDSFSYTFYDFRISGEVENPFNFQGLVMGKKSIKNVGSTPGNREVAGSLKGSFLVFTGMLLDIRQDLEGTANISMTLNNTYTKGANDTGPSWTQDQIIHGQMISGVLRGIIPDLEAKHYEDATPTP